MVSAHLVLNLNFSKIYDIIYIWKDERGIEFMENAELIKELRECANWIEAVAASSQYTYDELMALYYGDKLRDAADVLEADEQRNADLSLDCELFQQKCMELGAQMPKEGEWIVEEIDDSGFKWCKWHCSVCREVVKKGWQHTKDGEKPRHKYCPNCGAKMRENGRK